jgi:hypothetical protein
LVYRLEAATSAGIVTVGALPNVPVAFTTLLLAATGPVGAADAEAGEDGAADDVCDPDDEGFAVDDGEDVDEAQPAAAAAASKGTTRSAAARRIRTSRVGLAAAELKPRLSDLLSFFGFSKPYPGYPQLTVGLLSASDRALISLSRFSGYTRAL